MKLLRKRLAGAASMGFLLAAGLTACAAFEEGASTEPNFHVQESLQESLQESAVQASDASQEQLPESGEREETGLEEVASLVGMKDEETAKLLGGGEENWTEDRSFYIGRRYEVQLFGSPYKIFTTCGQDNTVESVSIWIVSGERQVTDEETEEWENRVTEMMGTSPVYDEEVSEGGSRNCRWNAQNMAATMNRMADILTVSFQPAVGELK